MYSREYFCFNCGLYYWESYPSPAVCPNKDCPSHNDMDGQSRYACDSTGFHYFSRDYHEYIKTNAWSSPEFAPEFAIEHYKEQGLLIK